MRLLLPRRRRRHRRRRRRYRRDSLHSLVSRSDGRSAEVVRRRRRVRKHSNGRRCWQYAKATRKQERSKAKRRLRTKQRRTQTSGLHTERFFRQKIVYSRRQRATRHVYRRQLQ